MTDERILLERLHVMLVDASNACGFGEEIEPIAAAPVDREVYEVSTRGVAVFLGDYMLAAWPPVERVQATAKTYRLIARRLEKRGLVRFMVHSGNFRSIIAVRRLGSSPHGVDEEGYIHYLLTRDGFANRGRRTGLKAPRQERTSHGQEDCTAENS
jgi:hypothetical protein